MTRIAIIGLIVVGIIGAAWWSGWGASQNKQDRAYIETMERINDADLSSGDAAADLEWLRNRGK